MADLGQAEAAYLSLGAEGQRKSEQGWPRYAWPVVCVALCVGSFSLGGKFAQPQQQLVRAQADQTTQLQGKAVAAAAPMKLFSPRMLPIYESEPMAKNIIRRFDLYLMNGATFDAGDVKVLNVGQWLAPEFVYDTVGFPNSYSLRDWCLGGEEAQYRTAFPTTSFSQMLFFGTDEYATTTTYGNAQWMVDLFGIPAPREWTYFRVTDFYHARRTGPNSGLIDFNFMMIDFADLFRRVGRPVLPPATLPEGFVMTAHANDGVPAPLSVVVTGRDRVAAERAAAGALYDGWAGGEPAAKWWQGNMTFYGPGGIGLASSVGEFQQHVLDPYHAAFSDRTVDRRMLFCEGNYCGAFGTLWGNHVGTWVGLPASGKRLGLRFAMHFRIIEGRVQEGWAIFDFPGLFSQLGMDFFAMARDQMPVRR